MRAIRAASVFVALGVLQHSMPVCAAEPTQTGVTATVDFGSGDVELPSNYGSGARWDETHQGFGLFGVLRPSSLSTPSSPPAPASSPPTSRLRPRAARTGGGARQGAHPGARRSAESQTYPPPYIPGWPPDLVARDEQLQGFFVAGGVTLERVSLKRTSCGTSCYEMWPVGAAEFHFGARAGVGYGWRYFEFRVGPLLFYPGDRAKLAELLIMPDVLLRFGRRRVGYVDIGLGAYDAPTTLRPGLHAGGQLRVAERVAIWSYVSINLPVGLCCSEPLLGLRVTLGVDYSLSARLALGVFAAVQSASGSAQGASIIDAGPRLRVSY